MNWQVRYALENFQDPGSSTAVHVTDELIRITPQNQPEVLAAILDNNNVDEATAEHYLQKFPNMDFLCGYRTTCVWGGAAIRYLKENRVGWGNFGTLCSAANDGNANVASHKVYWFADRLLRQYGCITSVNREFDRVHTITLRSGANLRIGMIAEYEPTADVLRSFWDQFGPIDVAWNINPNGSPTNEAAKAARDLGCEVLKWDDLKEYMKKK